MTQVVIVGAGIGGLTAGAVLARAGTQVTVLEAHVYPGGSAGTFFHQGYRFDAGATLAGGFYPGGPMDIVAQAAGIDQWPTEPAEPAMVVHLPERDPITRWTDARRWNERRAAFGEESLDFWRWQEATADALWALALRGPDWPPQSMQQVARLGALGIGWLTEDLARANPALAADAIRPVAAHLRGASQTLRLFIDAQLLISAQTTSDHAYALYGASALDLPRRGVAHLRGGMGAVSEALIEAIRRNGGEVIMRQEVTRIVHERGKPIAVETKRGESFPAERVILNMTPWSIARLLDDDAPLRLKRLPEKPRTGWGAFTVHVGFDGSIVPANFPLHHQIVARRPLGEGNTVFLSLTPEWDETRAPQGMRGATLSTHTILEPWWRLYQNDADAYAARKDEYANRLLELAERALPGLRDAATLVLPGTPVTFQRFTRRAWGWVGGFPQTNLFTAWGPKLSERLWMVGDSIFPGQSMPAVALGGLRVARVLLEEPAPEKPVIPVAAFRKIEKRSLARGRSAIEDHSRARYNTFKSF